MRHLEKCKAVSSKNMDLFSMPKLLTSVSDSIMVSYPPQTSLDSDSIAMRFNIPGNSDTYLNVANAYLMIEGHFEKISDNTKMVANKKICLCNNALYSLYDNCEISINGKVITQPNYNLPYIAYLINRLNYGSDAKQGYLQCVGWYEDTPGQFDSGPPVAAVSSLPKIDADLTAQPAIQAQAARNATAAIAGNSGFKKRQSLAYEGKTIQMYGKIISDFTNQDRLLINGCELSLVFYKSRENFHIMDLETAPNNGKHRFVETKALLVIERIRPSPDVLLDDAASIQTSPALYPMLRSEIRLFTIPAAVHSKEIPSITSSKIPTRLICGLVENEGLHGKYNKNPFNFQNYNLRSLSLTVGGRSYPSRPLELDYTNNHYMSAYMQLYDGLGINYSDRGFGIPYNDFPNGNCLYVFDLTVNKSANCSEYIEADRDADVNIHLYFATATPHTVSLVVYTETPALMEINKDREVYIE